MEKQSKSDALRTQIYQRMQEKDTEELITIWQEHDLEAWSESAFEVVQKILIERLGKLPEASVASSANNPAETKTEKPSPEAQNKPKSAYSASRDHSLSQHLELAMIYLKKRNFKVAMEECEEAIKIDAGLSVAQELRNLIQDRKNLYTRGEFSIIFGFSLLAAFFMQCPILARASLPLWGPSP
jgi:hypothetical protein